MPNYVQSRRGGFLILDICRFLGIEYRGVRRLCRMCGIEIRRRDDSEHELEPLTPAQAKLVITEYHRQRGESILRALERGEAYGRRAQEKSRSLASASSGEISPARRRPRTSSR